VASKVFVHVGSPLAPSTALRDALGRHRRRLARVGMLYPPGHLGDDGGHRDAVLDVLGLTAGDHAPPRGAWDRLAETVRDWRRGTAVVSHELLADASSAQADRVVSSLGDAEVHVVYVAQDLGRQLPLAWQQWVRAGGGVPFATYAAKVAERDPHRVARVFWRSHDLGAVLSRWAAHVPAERVHVVSVPHRDDAWTRTWARFARTLGIDPERFRLGPVADDSLAPLAGTEVLRLLNAAHSRIDPERRSDLLRATVAVEGGTPRLPETLREALAAEAAGAAEALERHGWDLVGSPDDLAPAPEAFTCDPARVTPPAEQVVSAQTTVIGALCGPSRARRGPAGVHRRALRVVTDRVRP
jgi:hypothetical protein